MKRYKILAPKQKLKITGMFIVAVTMKSKKKSALAGI